MKKILLIFLFLIGTSVSAQNSDHSGLELDQCMNFTKPEAMQAMLKIQTDAMKMYSKLESFCAKGKVSKAAELQRSFAQEIIESKKIGISTECAAVFVSQLGMPGMEDTTIAGANTGEKTPKNICEAFSLYEK